MRGIKITCQCPFCGSTKYITKVIDSVSSFRGITIPRCETCKKVIKYELVDFEKVELKEA